MNAQEILDAIDALPVQEQTRVCRTIYDRVVETFYNGFIGIDETFRRYAAAMESVTGEDVRLRCRRPAVVWARNIVAWQMTEDGFSTTQIGRRLGIDHSTVTHCRNAVRSMLEDPRFYPEEMAVFRKFKNAIQ